ncbi:MAG: DUF11 domain-containing protein [Pirellulaceae bacterium]
MFRKFIESFQDHQTKSIRRERRKRARAALSRSLRHEPLEDRRVLAALVVNSFEDNLTSGDGLVTLREAIIAANTDATTDLNETGSGADTITFEAGLFTPGSSEMVSLSLGELAITSDLSIEGPGANVLTIDAQNNSRIFDVSDGAGTLINVSISGLTMARGFADDGNPQQFSDGDVGGAIKSRENLTITDSVIRDSNATSGGGISIDGGSTTLLRSTISGNQATLSGGGIGIYSDANILNSTISGNSAGVNGGGVNRSRGSATIANSTISGNSAGSSGGGVYNAVASSSAFTIDNTIIAGSIAGGDIVDGPVNLSGTNNLIQDGNIPSGLSNSVTGDPMLGPLQDNGGPTPTHALSVGSPAIDAGDDTIATSAGLTTDQRGEARFDGTVDIGAFELENFVDLQVSVVDSADPVGSGENITYTITIGNAGTLTATGVAINNPIPANTTFFASIASQGVYSAASEVWTVGTIPSGGTVTLALTVQVDPTAADGTVITNAATITDLDQTDSNSSDNSASETTNVALDTVVSLVGNVLTITDADGGDSDDDWTISHSAGTFTIQSNNGTPLYTVIAGSTGNGTSTLTIPDTGVSSVMFDGLGGDDKLTVDLSAGSFPSPIVFNGGDQATSTGDSLEVTNNPGSPLGTVTFGYADMPSVAANGNDGTIDLDGLLITYTGLEPMNVGTADNIVFNLTNNADEVTLRDAGGGQFTIEEASGGLEATTIHYPAAGGSITINGQDGDDQITVDSSFIPNSNTAFDFDGEGGTDVLTVNQFLQTTTNSIAFTAETIRLGDNQATDGGSITLSGNVVLTSDVILDSESGGDGTAGAIQITGKVSGDAAGRSLQIISGTAGANDAGNVTLGGADGSGGALLDTLSINAATGTGTVGDISITGDYELAGSFTFTGNSLVSNSNMILGAGISSTTGDIEFDAASSLQFAIDGTVAGTGHNQLDVTGAVSLAGPSLLLSGTYVPVVGDLLTIINNDGADAITGNFAGLPEGGVIPNFLGSTLLATISYVGGDGNDVVLTVTNGVSVAVAPASVDEDGADNLVYTFTRGDSVGDLTVNFTLSGSGVFNNDFTMTGATLVGNSGTVVIPDGSTTATVTIDPVVDTTVEADETVVLTVDAGSFYIPVSPTVATGTIVNDDFDVLVDGSGNLVLDDPDGSQNDQMTIRVDGTNYVVTDSVNGITAGPGAVQVDANTITIPLASVTGAILVTTRGGNDQLSIDRTGGDLPNQVDYDGGVGGTDTLAVLNGTATTLTFNFVSESDGSVDIDGNVINYVGLEPVMSTITPMNVVFNFTGGTETITLQDDATPSDNVSMIDSTLGEMVSFVNPTNSLTVNSGSGVDTVNVNPLDAMYAASLILDGGATDSDAVTLTDVNLINTPGRGLWLREFETINVVRGTISGNMATIGGGVLIDNSTTASTTATLDDVTITGNTATGGTAPLEGGGGIYNRGANLSIINTSEISNNLATTGAGSGGGILSTGTLTIEDSTVSGNDANRAGGGIEIASGSGTTTLNNATVTLNDALGIPGNGGGLHVTGVATTVITDSTFMGNTAAAEGGGIWNSDDGSLTITGSLISQNAANSNAADEGGSIFNDGGVVNIGTLADPTTITLNTAREGIREVAVVFSSTTPAACCRLLSSVITLNVANRAGGGIEAAARSTAI